MEAKWTSIQFLFCLRLENCRRHQWFEKHLSEQNCWRNQIEVVRRNIRRHTQFCLEFFSEDLLKNGKHILALALAFMEIRHHSPSLKDFTSKLFNSLEIQQAFDAVLAALKKYPEYMSAPYVY